MGRLSIRTRLTLVYSGLLFLALMLAETAVVNLLEHRLTVRLDASLDERLQGVENFLRRETTAANAYRIAGEIAEYASTQPEGHLIEVRDGSGRILFESHAVPSPSRSRERSFTLYGQLYRTWAAASLLPIEESVHEVRSLLWWSAPLLLLLVGVSGYWISSRSLRPVDEMTRGARSISISNLGARLNVPTSRDEVSRLAEAWNEMLARLGDSVSRMQRFTADAAHELRTPLTVIRTTAELTLRRQREPEEYRHALKQIVDGTERMTALTESLLALARGNNPSLLSLVRIDIASLVRGVVAEMRPMFDEKSIHLQLELPATPAFCDGDLDGLRRVTVVLLDNARKYTPPDGKVSISLRESTPSIDLEIHDTGCGIPAESLPRVFDPFYRVDSSRDKHTGGHGLGLAIAQQIVRAHQGTIEASSEVGAGTTFRFRLPKKAPHV
jgi:heavy metal sensor kinase